MAHGNLWAEAAPVTMSPLPKLYTPDSTDDNLIEFIK